MNGDEARDFVSELARGFRRRQSLAGLLRVIAIGLPLGALALALGLGTLGVLAALGVAVLAVQALLSPPRADTYRMARHLDRVALELEDSAGLILRDEDSLEPLQRLQRHRVLSELEKLDRARILGPVLRRRSLILRRQPHQAHRARRQGASGSADDQRQNRSAHGARR